ncbi:MAG: type II secretion system protein GspC [Nitrospiraceae bacterium]
MPRWTTHGLILAFVATLAFVLAHWVSGVLSHALLPPLEYSASTIGAATTASPPRDLSQLLRDVQGSRLFASPPPGATPVGGGPTGPAGTVPIANRPPLNVAGKLRLLGTAVGDETTSVAVVEEIAGKKQGAYRLREMIVGVGEVHAINKESVVIGLDGQEEELFLDILQRPVAVAPTGPQTAAVAPGTVVTPGGGRPLQVSVDRAELDQTLSNIPALMTQARAMPYMNNGKIDGFRLDYIQKNSFFEKLGLQAGDVLQRINGVELRDPGAALGLFQQLRNERNVAVDVLRNNQRTTIAYDIRG